MKEYNSSAELKDSAKERMQGNYSQAVLMNIIVYVLRFSITMIISFFLNFFILFASFSLMQHGNGINTHSYGMAGMLFILNQVFAVFMGVFNVGISLFYLNVVCKKPASIRNLFYGFQFFGKSIKLSFLLVFVNMLIVFPLRLFTGITEGYIARTNLTPVILLQIICLIIYIPLSLGLSQAYFLMLDFPGLSVTELVVKSISIMKGHKRKLFYLQLSFFPLMLLGLLSLFIGFLWLIPYMNATYALFFLDIMKPSGKSSSKSQSSQ